MFDVVCCKCGSDCVELSLDETILSFFCEICGNEMEVGEIEVEDEKIVFYSRM